MKYPEYIFYSVSYLSACQANPGEVKLHFGGVKKFYNHIEIVCYLSKCPQNGHSDECHKS